MMTVVGLNRFKARAHYFDDLVIAPGNEGCERRADAFFVVSYQHAHGLFCRTFHASAPIIALDCVMSCAPTPSLFEIWQEPGKQTYEWKVGTDLKDKGNTRAIGHRTQHGGADTTQTEGETEK
jgi:hypothetical protein